MARYLIVDLGESNAAVAKRLGMDLTTVAHHLALLTLPEPLGAAVRSGRCAAPRTLRARAADVSQGTFVAGLIDGSPPPRAAPDRRQAIATLARSTDQLAILSTDLNALMRLLLRGSSEQAKAYRDRLDSLSTDVHGHLDVASRFLADLQDASLARPGRRPSRRRA